MKQKQNPPIAKQIPHEHKLHGDVRPDPYFWLKERENPQVKTYLEAENAYVKQVMEPTEKLQAKLFEELKGRIKPDDATVPVKDGDYYYYVRYEKNKEYAIYCRKSGSLDAKEEIILDSNELAKGHDYFSIASVKPSQNHQLLAFAVDTVGRRLFTVRFKDLQTGKILKDEIANITPSYVWANDNKTFFYVRQNPETLRFEKVFKHTLGEESAKDPLVYEEKDLIYDVFVYKTLTERFLMMQSASKMSSEVRFLDANTPSGKWQVVQPRQKGLEYDVSDAGDRFFIRTNDQAVNFRLVAAPHDKPGKKNWQEIVPHRADTFLEDTAVFKNQLVLQERQNGLTRLHIYNRDGKGLGADHYLKFNDPTYVVGVGDNREFDMALFRYDYQSMTTPASVFDYNIKTGETVLKKQEEVLGGFKIENYESQRLEATAADGVKVPISVVYRKGTNLQNGKSPLFIYGYGSYGHSTDPGFNARIISLLDRGFIYALAHIRGGSEMGRPWYDNGKMLNKRNTFSDFVACTEYLQKLGYSTPQHTYAMGGSAGGLLMGAVINLRPDLYKGIIASVPFVDVVTTMLDADIPLTTAEYEEWGNPNEKKYYDYIKSYSPYDNVVAKAYPNMLVTTGFHDSQVQYWEPAKWVAKLRTVKTDDNVILFKTDFGAGHGGKAGRFERLKLVALNYAFVLSLEGIDK